MTPRDPTTVHRRMVVLSRYSLRGFSAMNGNPARPDVMRSYLRRHALMDEVRPAERALLLSGEEPSPAQITEATWRSEALVALRWAIGDRETLEVGGQVSLTEAVPELGTDDQVRRLLARATLRPTDELRRALELWFVVYWRLRLRKHGVARLDLRQWVVESPYLTVLTAADVPMIGDDLSLDAGAMRPAADELDIEYDDEWPPVENGRWPLHACTPGMLTAGENVLRVASERLAALRWLFGVTTHLDEDGPGCYRPDSPVAADKRVLYGPDAPPLAADAHRYDPSGGMALHRAAWRGDLETLRRLVEAGVDTLAPDIDGDYPIHCAVLGGHHEAMEALASDPFANHLADVEGRMPLHLAASRGDVDAIGVLADGDRVDDGLDLDAVDGRGSTALQEAVRRGHLAAVDRLDALGASLEGALDAAIDADRAAMVRSLAGLDLRVDVEEHGTTPLYRALFTGRLASAEALLDLGADPTFVHPSGTSALHVAADRGATALCLRLLDGGADLDRRLEGMGAVHLAILGGHTECALALVERGADLTGFEQPPLALALRGGSEPLIRWCLARGEPLDSAPEAMRTCAREGWAEALAALLAAGAAPAELDEHGNAPLHWAADRGRAGCIEVLLRAGAPVDLPTAGKRFTPLHLAAMYGHDDCVRLLLAAGADRSARDADAHDALDWAVDGRHGDCVALLT
jgi:ankyrin repeat protein